MRPRELTLRGFRSFAEPTSFHFRGRGLVGIVGPIGSGKSSILDAISFALYGRTPRSGTETSALINQRRDALQVELVFEVDGVEWKVVRALRRRGAAAHTLYRRSADGPEEEVADKAREVTERITALIGMEFDAFRRSVLLAQNQFAAFLEATGTDRNQVLKGVFGFDRIDAMRDVIKGRLDVIGMSLQHLTARRTSAEGDRRRLDSLGSELVAADQRAQTLEALRGSVMQAEEALRTAEAGRAAAVEQSASLDEIGDRIPNHADTAGLFAAAAAAAERISLAERAAAAATAATAAAATRAAEVLASVGGQRAMVDLGDAVAGLGAARNRHREAAQREQRSAAALVTADEAVQSAAAALSVAEQAAVGAAEAAAEAETTAASAQGVLHAAHDADRAATLRVALVAGEPCPVCAQKVATLPPLIGMVDVEPVAAAARSAEAAAVEARTRVAESGAQAAAARARHTAATERADAERIAAAEAADVGTAAGVAVAELENELGERLGPGDPVEALGALRARVEEAEVVLRREREAESQAEKERRLAATEHAEARRGLERLRTSMAAVAGRLGIEPGDGDDAGAIDTALKALRTEWTRRRTESAEALQRSEHAAGAARGARTDLLEKAGLAATDDIVEIATEAMKTRTALETETRVLEQRLAELESLGAEEAATIRQRTLLERLHADLAPSKFLEFLLDERRRLLADLAGVHFATLTAGRYRFSDDGAFDVVDLAAADQVRGASSLSGGESFLASLALALALAEIVGREGGRLDSFLLDEGFGSLDTEHLDLAMDGVERLVAAGGDRLVVVVSHVPELRDRFDDLIVLDRDAVTGVTHVVSGAGTE